MARYVLILLLCVAVSCNKTADQIGIAIDSKEGQKLKNTLTDYADSVDNQVRSAIKQESLIFTQGDYSFYVTRFVKNSQSLLYIERGSSESRGTIENKYYLKNGKVVLFNRNISNPKAGLPFTSMRTFYKMEKALFSERKIAASSAALDTISYNASDDVYMAVATDMKRLNDAIYQRGQFDLVLEGITEYPKARFLVLSRKNFNAYRAALKIEKDDELIRSIAASPEKYRGRKLDLSWSVKTPTKAVYVSGSLAN